MKSFIIEFKTEKKSYGYITFCKLPIFIIYTLHLYYKNVHISILALNPNLIPRGLGLIKVLNRIIWLDFVYIRLDLHILHEYTLPNKVKSLN